MYRPRIIPVLLLQNLGLVKTTKFSKPVYVGDPMNAVRIFNDLQADELVFLDIDASKQKRKIDLNFVKRVGSVANMPFSVGGGINCIEDIKQIINAGAEKVIINSAACLNPSLIEQAAKEFGSSTIAVSIDSKKKRNGENRVYISGGSKKTKLQAYEMAKIAENHGAGELVLNSIDRDGMMEGYDLELVKKISENTTIPLVAVGGAGNLSHMKDVLLKGCASAAAAGSIFVFHGPRKAVLINYPDQTELKSFVL